MKYVKNMYVGDVTFNEMERICELPVQDCKKDALEFHREVTFPDGMRMAIQVIGPTEPGTESCWTQGVLFDSNGNEIGCTDVGEEFGGEYCIQLMTNDENDEKDGDEYVVIVTKKQIKLSPSEVLNNLHVMFQWMENEGIDIRDAWGQIGITSWEELYAFIEDARDGSEQ